MASPEQASRDRADKIRSIKGNTTTSTSFCYARIFSHVTFKLVTTEASVLRWNVYSANIIIVEIFFYKGFFIATVGNDAATATGFF